MTIAINVDYTALYAQRFNEAYNSIPDDPVSEWVMCAITEHNPDGDPGFPAAVLEAYLLASQIGKQLTRKGQDEVMASLGRVMFSWIEHQRIKSATAKAEIAAEASYQQAMDTINCPCRGNCHC